MAFGERIDGFRTLLQALDVGTVAEDQQDGDDCIDNREFNAEHRSFLDGDEPSEPVRVPRNGNRQDGHSPGGEGADDGGDDGGKGDVFGTLGHAEEGEAGEDELNPRGKDVHTHEAGDGFAAFEAEEDGPAMAKRGE